MVERLMIADIMSSRQCPTLRNKNIHENNSEMNFDARLKSSFEKVFTNQCAKNFFLPWQMPLEDARAFA
jgi:hypothetical protein